MAADRDDTPALTRAIAAGDPEAFARIYSREFDGMFRVAMRVMGGREADALDVVHDAFLRIVRGMRPLESAGALRAFTLKATHRAALDRLRAERRRALREQRAVGQDDIRRGLDSQIAKVRAALREAPDEDSELLGLRFRSGWTLAAIGARLGLGAGAVDGRIRRSLGRVRERMEEAGDG